MKDRVFESFFTTKDSGEGTGLGQSLVARVVEGLGGRIELDSEAGEETTFEVWLPLCLEPSLRGGSGASPAVGLGQKVLVVDDEMAVRGVLVRMLKRAGYDVQAASSGAKALALYDSTEDGGFDLLITDAVRPGMGGSKLYQSLIDRSYDGGCIVCSRYSETMPTDFFADPPRLFVGKPFRQDELLGAVATLLADNDA